MFELILQKLKSLQDIKNLKDQNKKDLFVGVVLIIIAFLCTIIIFYFIISTHKETVEEVGVLKEKVGILSTEKQLAKHKISKLKSEVGKSLYIDNILDKANKIYDEKEKARREGYLWIDRGADTYIATLGALHGVTSGSRLVVYDGDKEIGHVRVDTAMDVVSYVYPTNNDSADQFPGDYYRVVFEEE